MMPLERAHSQVLSSTSRRPLSQALLVREYGIPRVLKENS